MSHVYVLNWGTKRNNIEVSTSMLKLQTRAMNMAKKLVTLNPKQLRYDRTRKDYKIRIVVSHNGDPRNGEIVFTISRVKLT